ncbi:cytochrome c [Pigmentiphaga soli]|uniref:Cytochrome c n=1 Tax=Pigmentiphaga soli TaxID=1007095 RepID=A0ABP8GUX5_9BURK
MRTFARIVLGLVVLLVAAASAMLWLGYRDRPAPAAANAAQAAPADPAALVEQGRYLASVGNCMGCHTATGGKPFAGGRALPTPFGRFYGPNLTPDDETGIGRWSADDFWHALHDGKAPDGSLLYPAFPYPSYTRMRRADADALYAYLRSLPAVRQPNRAHELSFPYDQRPLIAFWRALYFRGAPADGAGRGDAASAQWLRGQYLVEGLAHCAECHTPRNRLGALDASAGLTGAVIPGQNWYAPPLTADAVTGLGQWSEQDIVDLLKTGLARQSHASGPMAEAVHVGFQHASDADLQAMAAYIKSVPAAGLDAAAQGGAAGTAVLERGGRIYGQQCAQCHQDDGRGREQAWPPLAGNISVVAASPVNAIRMVLSGGFAPVTAADPQPHGMPPFGQSLDDQDVAAVVTYIRQSWGNRAPAVALPEVRRVRETIR